MRPKFFVRQTSLVSLSLLSAIVLSACGPVDRTAVQQPAPSPSTISSLLVPLSCIETKMLTVLKKTVPTAKYLNTAWAPAQGSELADVLNNAGIACTYGIASAGVGLTAMWVRDISGLFDSRIGQWLKDGHKKVDVPQMDEDAAYFWHKPQSTSQEFNVWQLDLKIHGFWIQLGLSFGENLLSGNPYIQAAVDSLAPKTPLKNVVGCYVGRQAKDRYIIDITYQKGIDIKAKIAYLNYQKDSSLGTFIGTYEKGILTGIYSFNSEGMDSRRELFFRQVNQGFVPGYGKIEVVGDEVRLRRPLNLTWNISFLYLPSSDCTFA